MLVRYIGRLEPFFDTLFGTHMRWEMKGDVREVDDEIGRRMCSNHPDVYEEAKKKLKSKKHEYVQLTATARERLQTTPFEEVLIERRGGMKTPVMKASRADLIGLMDRLGLKTSSGMTKQQAYMALEAYYEKTGSLSAEPEDSVGGLAAAQPDAELPGTTGAAQAEEEQGDGSGLQPNMDSSPEAAETPPPDSPPPDSPAETAEPEDMPMMGNEVAPPEAAEPVDDPDDPF